MMIQKVSVYGSLCKADEMPDGTLRVEGIASAETVDSAGETILASAMRDAIPSFMNQGRGSLREMHRADIAAGTVDEVDVGDDGFTRVVCTVVDNNSIRKIKKKVLRGLSVGGRVLERDKKNSKIITKVAWTELSLVDRPCCSEAVLLAKALPAEPLGQRPAPGGTDQMEPVRSLGDLTEAEVADFLARLPAEQRAQVIIMAVRRAGVGRKF